MMMARDYSTNKARCLPPTLSSVKSYFASNGISSKAAESFFFYQQANKWKTKSGKAITNWKVAARSWMDMFQQVNRPHLIEIKLRLQISSAEKSHEG